MRKARSLHANARLLALAATTVLASCAGAPTPDPKTPAGPRNGRTPNPTATVQGSLHTLPNGVTVHALPHHARDMAQVQLGIIAGADFDEPGIAELAAQVLVHGSDASSGRKSLAQAIEGFGGTLRVEVGPFTTSLTVRVPEYRWSNAQLALREALSSPATSRSQIKHIREDYVRMRMHEIWNDRNAEVALAFQQGFRGTADYIGALLERDASEVSGFLARHYRADAAVVTIQVPGRIEIILEKLTEGLGKWPAPTGPLQAPALTKRRMREGIHWAPMETMSRCHVSLVLPLPELTAKLAAEQLVMHSCMTLDGIGGRLEKIQRERGLDRIRWTPSFIRIAGAPALALGASVNPADVEALWYAADAARKSLLELPPTRSELELATRRAELTARLLAADSASRSRLATALTVNRTSFDLIVKAIADCADPRSIPAKRAAEGYLERKAALIVIGSQPPTEGRDITTFELLPPGALQRLASSNPVAQALAATPWLEKAYEAIGGMDALRRTTGCESRCTLRTEAAPEVVESVRWQSATGELARERTVMNSTILTQLTRGGGSEVSGEQTINLPMTEVARIRREMRRHPVELLAAATRGELRFRPVAQRTVADREFMVLETIDGEFDRLRIHIDSVSNLVRVVEVWDTTAEGAYVHMQEAWSDYRTVGALRVPFRRMSEVDDGASRVETIWSEWRPRVE